MSTGKVSTVNTPGGTITLQRYPRRRGEQKLAWNSADLLLLDYAAASGSAPANTLVVNDEFGALAVSLGAECCVWSDSALARLALCQNAELNSLKPPRLIPVTETPAGDFSLVLLRVPKQLSLLRYQLQILRESLAEGTLVVCGGMDKHLPRTLADTLEEFLGETERHRGERKARLFSVRVDKSCSATEVQGRQYFCEELGLQISSRPNVFSAAQLDIGTRALLEQMSRLPAVERVADLGCGNGVLGLAALQHNPQTRFRWSLRLRTCTAIRVLSPSGNGSYRCQGWLRQRLPSSRQRRLCSTTPPRSPSRTSLPPRQTWVTRRR